MRHLAINIISCLFCLVLDNRQVSDPCITTKVVTNAGRWMVFMCCRRAWKINQNQYAVMGVSMQRVVMMVHCFAFEMFHLVKVVLFHVHLPPLQFHMHHWWPLCTLLHLHQLSIFGMITRLNENILHKHAVNIFTLVTISPKSWFHQIRKWCLLYNLPHPLELLATSPLKAY